MAIKGLSRPVAANYSNNNGTVTYSGHTQQIMQWNIHSKQNLQKTMTFMQTTGYRKAQEEDLPVGR